MRNEFFGDVADYSKYGILREMGRAKLNVVVAWMLTPDQGTPGRHIGYLRRPNEWRKYDPVLFDWLSEVVGKNNRREVKALEEDGLIANITFIRRRFPADPVERARYFQMAAKEAVGADILFLDPDTGIANDGQRVRSIDSNGYVCWDEIEQFFRAGCSLLIYQHYRRGGAARIDGCYKMQSRVGSAFGRVDAAYVATLGLSTTAFLLLGQARHTAMLDLALRRIEWQWRDKIVICKHHRVTAAAVGTVGVNR
jgi:hypothetical protein